MNVYVVVLSSGEYDAYNVRNLYAGTDPWAADAVAKANMRARGVPFSIYIEIWKDGRCTEEVIMVEWGDV